MRFDRLPVVREAAVAVPHGVGVLAHDQRALAARGLRPADDLLDLRVHRTDHVGGRVIPVPVELQRALVVQGAGGVEAADPATQGFEVRAAAGLVPERPEDDAGVVLVPLHHAHAPVEEGGGEAGLVTEIGQVCVALDVGLVDHVEAVFVAELVPKRIVGIVGGAHRIEVELLHQADVGEHRFPREGLSRGVVVLVPVDSLDQHRAAVHEQLAPADLDLAEADPAAHRFAALALGVDQGDHDPVQVRGFRRPLARRPDPLQELRSPPAEEVGIASCRYRLLERLAEDVAAAGIEEADADLPSSASSVRKADLRIDLQETVPVLVVQIPDGEDVGNVGRPGGVEVDVPIDSGHEPVVLVFEEGSVGPADHHGCDEILTRLDELRHVELGGEPRVLAHAHRMSVYVDVEHTLGAAEVEHHPTPLPAFGNLKAPPVEPGGVLLRNRRRRLGKRHLHIRVVGAVVALEGPVAGNRNPGPARVVEVAREEVFGARLRLRTERELPVAVQRLEPGRALGVARQRRVGVRKGDQRAAGGKPSHPNALGSLPGSPLRSAEAVHRRPSL